VTIHSSLLLLPSHSPWFDLIKDVWQRLQVPKFKMHPKHGIKFKNVAKAFNTPAVKGKAEIDF
jgi:hypothetical protein